MNFELVTDLESARSAWTLLSERSRNVFGTWEWGSTWWRHVGGDRPLRIVVARRPDGRPALLLPLYEWRRAPRTLRFLGHGVSDRLAPVCAPGDAPLARSALVWLASRRPAWDVLLAESMPCEEQWSRKLRGRRLGQEPSPTLEFGDDGWDGFLRSRTHHFRSRLRQRERKLRDRYRVEFRRTHDPERLPADLDLLVRLHDLRWGDRSGSFAGSRRAFHREFAQQALERGWLALWFLELDGRPVASLYNLRYGGVEWGYQGGRDPSLADGEVGMALTIHAMREAAEAGMREFRFLRGGEAYKARLATVDHGLETVMVSRGVVGDAAMASVGVARRFPCRLRSAATARLRVHA